MLTRGYFLCRRRLFLICSGANAEMHALKRSFTDKHIVIQENFKKKFTDLEKENALCRKTNEGLVKDSKNK